MPLVSPETLARTYNPPTDRDPWEQVQLYRQSQRYPDDWGGTRVASAINADEDQPWEGLVRSNLRAWVEGDGMPDAARAVAVAEDNGWLDDEWTPTVRAVAGLAAGIFACGSIDRTGWVPRWAPDSAMAEATIEAALERIGVGVTRVNRTANAAGERRGDELRPGQHDSVLGRALHVAGAPVGDKNSQTVTGLPEWVETAPPAVRASVAELLVRERGAQRSAKATRMIQAARPPGYFQEVADLIADVTGEQVTASDAGVTISADAVRALGLG
jgi:hypothetical protein